MNQDALKQAVAREAVKHVVDDAYIGVGSGSTANFFIDELAKIKGRIKGAVASSAKTAERLKSHGIAVEELNNAGDLPVYIDGADEVTEHGAMIKGGGGALTREKIVAAASRKFVCIADDSKLVPCLGKFPLPIEVIPMARSYVARELAKLGGQPEWRMGFTTDNGNVILDVRGLEHAQSRRDRDDAESDRGRGQRRRVRAARCQRDPARNVERREDADSRPALSRLLLEQRNRCRDVVVLRGPELPLQLQVANRLSGRQGAHDTVPQLASRAKLVLVRGHQLLPDIAGVQVANGRGTSGHLDERNRTAAVGAFQLGLVRVVQRPEFLAFRVRQPQRRCDQAALVGLDRRAQRLHVIDRLVLRAGCARGKQRRKENPPPSVVPHRSPDVAARSGAN